MCLELFKYREIIRTTDCPKCFSGLQDIHLVLNDIDKTVTSWRTRTSSVSSDKSDSRTTEDDCNCIWPKIYANSCLIKLPFLLSHRAGFTSKIINIITVSYLKLLRQLLRQIPLSEGRMLHVSSLEEVDLNQEDMPLIHQDLGLCKEKTTSGFSEWSATHNSRTNQSFLVVVCC